MKATQITGILSIILSIILFIETIIIFNIKQPKNEYRSLGVVTAIDSNVVTVKFILLFKPDIDTGDVIKIKGNRVIDKSNNEILIIN